MRFAGLNNILKMLFQLQLEACWGGVIMASAWQFRWRWKKNVFWDRKWIYAKLL